jgi:predicted transcriptional regulator YheO
MTIALHQLPIYQKAQEIANAFTGRDLDNMLNHFAMKLILFSKELERDFSLRIFLVP